MRRIEAFLPKTTWPMWMRRCIFGSKHLVRTQRLQSVVFLMGNGVSADDTRVFLSPKMRDRAAKMHLQSIIADVQAGTYDTKWTYFNVCQKEVYFLGQRPCTDSKFAMQRKINSLDKFAYNHPLSLASQDAFLKNEVTCDPTEYFFGMRRA